jgi:hypothetical protein
MSIISFSRLPLALMSRCRFPHLWMARFFFYERILPTCGLFTCLLCLSSCCFHDTFLPLFINMSTSARAPSAPTSGPAATAAANAAATAAANAAAAAAALEKQKNKYKCVSHYIVGKTIGEGTFGKVKKGIHKLTGVKVRLVGWSWNESQHRFSTSWSCTCVPSP